jgi:single-stranded-DNA-specific exonuclease
MSSLPLSLFAESHSTPQNPIILPRYTPPIPRWSSRTKVESCDLRLAQQTGISPVVAAILRIRGYNTAAEIEAFFDPKPALLRDPAHLPDIEKAISRLAKAIRNGEKILVFGDYDVDGITSTALLKRSLDLLGANVAFRLPERDEGYGLSVERIEEAKERGFDLLLTADCGITAIEPAIRAREIGLDLIITDHHECREDGALPDALAVVNPKRPDSRYGFTGLSGCGVAYKVLQLLVEEIAPQKRASFENNYLDLVALSTIADCVPLCDENRYLTSVGLEQLYRTKKKGLRRLIEAAKFRDKGFFVGRDVSFGLAPRINAAGRLASPTLALRLLLSKDDAEIEATALELEELNSTRRGFTDDALIEAEQQIEREANLSNDLLLVAAGDVTKWRKGIVGLIAAKLVEKYNRPAFALSVHDGIAHGSGRSCADFDLHALLSAVEPTIIGGGGHAAACGLTLHEKNIGEFREASLEYASGVLSFEKLVPQTIADCEVQGRDLTLQLANELSRLEPCGTGNEPAVLMVRGAILKSIWPLKETHSKGRFSFGANTVDWVWWRSSQRLAEFTPGQSVDCLFVPEINEYRGERNVQLILKDMRPSAHSSANTL